jgi:hypothetical protein
MPLVVTAGTPTRMPDVTKGDLSSNGTAFLFKVICALIQRFLGFFTGKIFIPEIDQH